MQRIILLKNSSGLETDFRNLIIKVASTRAQRSAKFLDYFAKNNLNKISQNSEICLFILVGICLST